jgi:hypothetical protein
MPIIRRWNWGGFLSKKLLVAILPNGSTLRLHEELLHFLWVRRETTFRSFAEDLVKILHALLHILLLLALGGLLVPEVRPS